VRWYLFFFFLFLILLLLLLGVTGTTVMTEALGLQNAESLLTRTQTVQKQLRELYETVRTEEGGSRAAVAAVEEAAAEVDRLRGAIALLDLRKYYFRGVGVFLFATIFVTAAAGVMFWFGITRIFIRPLERIVDVMRQIGRGEFSISIKLSKTKEIRYIQEGVIQLAGEVRNSQERIKEMERQNIGRYLVHQVRNSITPIRLCTDVLKRGIKPFSAASIEQSTEILSERKESEEAIGIIEGETDKIEDIINRFRRLYTFPEPVMGDIELVGFLKGVVKDYPRAALENEIPTEPDEKLYIRGDVNLLEQALGNLLNNAQEADHKGNVILRLCFSVEGREEVGLSVEDKGPGIPETIRDSIFTDYVTTKKQGMGIGLSFVKRVMDLHGFPIELDTVEGMGTKVIVRMRRR
jgi:signal transduction histidine kinase